MVLDLQPSLDVFHWRRNKGDSPAGEYSCRRMAYHWEGRFVVVDVGFEERAVVGKGA